MMRGEQSRGKWVAVLLAASGLLMNTALFNAGTVGIPIFYGALVLILAAQVSGLAGNHEWRVPRDAMVVFAFGTAVLFAVMALQAFAAVGDESRELKQVASRSAFLVLFVVSASVLRSMALSARTLRYLVRGIQMALIYGFYQVAAGVLKLPLVLDFLRNSKSFQFSESGVSGWLQQFRAFSIWAEPSFCALPVGILLYYLMYESRSKWEKRLWWPVSIAFSVITFSRVVWAVVGLALLQSVAVHPALRAGILRRSFEKWKYAVVVLVALGGLQWATVADKFAKDESTLIRSSSVIIGTKIFMEHPLLGTGFNSFAQLGDKYAMYYTEESATLVHNLFISYAQQLGVFGLALAFLPIMYVLALPISLEKRWFTAMTFVLIGTLGGDFLYFSMAWVFLAALGSSGEAVEKVQGEAAWALRPGWAGST